MRREPRSEVVRVQVRARRVRYVMGTSRTPSVPVRRRIETYGTSAVYSLGGTRRGDGVKSSGLSTKRTSEDPLGNVLEVLHSSLVPSEPSRECDEEFSEGRVDIHEEGATKVLREACVFRRSQRGYERKKLSLPLRRNRQSGPHRS